MHTTRLNQIARELEAMLRDLLPRQAERPMAERHPDPLDDAVAKQYADRVAGDRDRDAKRMHEITAALDAIRNGEYGTCSECGEPIPEKRLAAIPWATACVVCAERIEAMELNGHDHALRDRFNHFTPDGDRYRSAPFMRKCGFIERGS